MPKITKQEAMEALYRAKEQLEMIDDDGASAKQATLNILADAGKTVGYKPAFRALVLGKPPEDAIKWN